MSVFSGLGDERFGAWKQDDTMKASDEMMREEAMTESAAESENESPTSPPSPDAHPCDVSKTFHPVLPRLSESPQENRCQAVELTQPKADSQPTQQTQPEPNDESTPRTRSTSSGGDFVEIRCIVERLKGSEESRGGRKSFVELDGVTLVPSSILLRDLVDTVLHAHRFESMDTLGATGAILPNSKWQAIRLDDVTLDSSATVGDIVSGIETSQMVLKITLPSFCCEQKLRETLLKFLLSIISFDVFTQTSCPLDKTMLDQLRVGNKKLNLSENKLSAFEQWVKEFDYGDQLQNGVHQPKKEAAVFSKFKVENGTSTKSSSPKSVDFRATSPHSSMTVFDPFTEITKLSSWFEVNPDPSLTDLHMYLDELNRQPHRHGNPATLNDVVNWFVEARAQVKTSVKSNLHQHEQLHSSVLKTSSLNGDKKRLRRSSSCEYESKSKESVVPRLPNKNAVYIVQPLLSDSSDSESAEVVQPTDDGDLAMSSCLTTITTSPHRSVDVSSTGIYEKSCMKSDENHNNWSNPSLVDVTPDQATDLSLVKRSHLPSTNPWNWKPVSLLDHTGRNADKKLEKDTREYEVSSGSSSPKAMAENTLPAPFYSPYPLATIAGLPIHPSQIHAATMQIFQQRALYNFSHPVFGPQPYELESVGSPGSGNEENDRRKRSRVFIDPTTEIPLLEQWYLADTHPSAQTIEHYTDELNKADYRQRFPKLEPKNVQLWFKNHRAKMKRLRMEQVKSESINGSNGFLRH